MRHTIAVEPQDIEQANLAVRTRTMPFCCPIVQACRRVGLPAKSANASFVRLGIGAEPERADRLLELPFRVGAWVQNADKQYWNLGERVWPMDLPPLTFELDVP